LSVGILFPHRRFEDAILAVKRVRDAGYNCRYDIIGSDRFAPTYGDELRQLVTDLSLHEVVTLRFESVSEADLTKAYQRTDALVFANDRQTWGLAPLEAMAKGVPVIVSRGAGVHEVLTDGDNALLVDPAHPEQIAQAILRLLESDDLRGRLGEAGRRLVLERFTSRHYAVTMLELFRECAAESRPRKA
jgi:glycosyltransferase involved in cell wall biosynthesis